MLLRTAKSCGPDAPTLASSSRSRVGPTGLRQDISADDGGKRARSPGRARRKPLKPLRAGMPGDSGVLVVTRVRSTTTSAHEAAGALGIRRSPRPLLGGRFINASGASRRGVVNACLMNTSAPHPQPSSPAKAGDPVFRGVSGEIEKLQRTGYPACAGYDGSWWSRCRVLSRMSRSLSSGAHSRDPLVRDDGSTIESCLAFWKLNLSRRTNAPYPGRQLRKSGLPRSLGLFGAAHQLDAWLRGRHQAAIGGEIVERHAVCGEAGLELLSDRMPAQPGQTAVGADRAGFILH